MYVAWGLVLVPPLLKAAIASSIPPRKRFHGGILEAIAALINRAGTETTWGQG